MSACTTSAAIPSPGACNLPGTLGHKITLWGYHVAQKIFKFN